MVDLLASKAAIIYLASLLPGMHDHLFTADFVVNCNQARQELYRSDLFTCRIGVGTSDEESGCYA